QKYDKKSTANDTNSIRRRDWLGGSTRPISPIAAARRPAAVATDAHTRTRSEPAMSVIDFASARPVMVIAPMKAPVRYVKTAAGWPGLVSRTVPSGIMSPLSRYIDGGADNEDGDRQNDEEPGDQRGASVTEIAVAVNGHEGPGGGEPHECDDGAEDEQRVRGEVGAGVHGDEHGGPDADVDQAPGWRGDEREGRVEGQIGDVGNSERGDDDASADRQHAPQCGELADRSGTFPGSGECLETSDRFGGGDHYADILSIRLATCPSEGPAREARIRGRCRC